MRLCPTFDHTRVPTFAKIILNTTVKEKREQAKFMASQILRKGLNGALVGAGVGMGATILYQFISGGGSSARSDSSDLQEQQELKYKHILEDGEINPIIDDLNAFREVSPSAYEKLLQSLDKFCGMSQLIQSFSSNKKRNGETFDPGWSITAHHHGESVRESLSAIEFSILDSMKEDFAEKKKEVIQFLDNTLYNINMHTQTILDQSS